MRIRENINDSWLFVHQSDCDPAVMPAMGEIVNLPHSWNAVDGHDGHAIHERRSDWSLGDMANKPKSGYDRGAYWYYRTFECIPQPLAGGRLYVEIPAAGLMATVYVNGKKVCYHEGGYSLFRADITDVVEKDAENLLAICVSNEYQSNVYPQFADFTFYGGLYRGVNLVSVARQHFDLDYYGAPGVMVTPVLKSADYAEITIQSFVKGADENDTVFYLVEDSEGNEVASATTDVCDTSVTLPICDPNPWSPDDPNLYLVTASILHRNEVVDEAYFDALFDNVTSLYRLDQIRTNTGASAGQDLGPLPKTAVTLLVTLVVVWVLIGAVALYRFVKARKIQKKP